MNNQTIIGEEVISVGANTTVSNMIIGVDGASLEITNGDDYTYNREDNTITFTGISGDCSKEYRFSKEIRVGNASATFSGTVTHSVKYEYPNTIEINGVKINNPESGEQTESKASIKFNVETRRIEATGRNYTIHNVFHGSLFQYVIR